ncbi:MAG: amino acid ABC transporter permease [Methylobacteriaceae bacterium]|nr:amino acid ABC transporter permease [Methylobacteriaceae bacterium]
MTDAARREETAKVSLLYDPRVRGIAFQALLLAFVVFLVYEAVTNALTNLNQQKIATGFGFWDTVSGFDINQALIDYSATSTYGRAFWVGLLNTLLVASIGIVLATFLGFAIGVARLSSNWIVAKLSMIYVEVIRNVPLLLQLLFWYNAVLKPLPEPRNSIVMPAASLGAPHALATALCAALGLAGWFAYKRAKGAEDSTATMAMATLGSIAMALAAAGWLFYGGLLRFAGESGVFLNNRGLILPRPSALAGFGLVVGALALGLVGAFLFRSWARKRQEATGKQAPVGLASLALIVGLPALVFFAAGSPIEWAYPQRSRFNLQGGLQVYPEFVALLIGLVTYTAGFIAEIVRAGILAVSKGQTEAAHALGLRPGPTLKLVVIPQAMRVIIPPLTSQYLNLTKNSSLAVFIGYPDLVQIFTGTVLNQTGQAVEVVALTMLVYLTISLTTAAFMNWYNARKALVER